MVSHWVSKLCIAFDVLNRPLTEKSDDGTVKLRRAWSYIAYDDQDPDFATHQSKNLFGQVEESRDADGVRFFEYDWRGLVLKTSHKFWDIDWTNSADSVWTDGSTWDPEVSSLARTDTSQASTQCRIPRFSTSVIPASFPGRSAGIGSATVSHDGGRHLGMRPRHHLCPMTARDAAQKRGTRPLSRVPGSVRRGCRPRHPLVEGARRTRMGGPA